MNFSLLRLAIAVLVVAALLIGAFLGLQALGEASAKDIESRALVGPELLRAAALESPCLNDAITKRVQARQHPTKAQLVELRAACGGARAGAPSAQ